MNKEEKEIIESYNPNLSNNIDELIKIAENQSTSPSELRRLHELNIYEINLSLCKNPNTPYDVLESLTNDANKYVRISVLAKRDCPIDLILKLAVDENEEVRSATRYYHTDFTIENISKMASNPDTDEELLNKIFDYANRQAKDEYILSSIELHTSLLNNPKCPQSILIKYVNMSVDERILKTHRANEYKRKALKHPNFSVELINQLFREIDNEDSLFTDGLFYVVLSNPNCPYEYLEKYVTSKEYNVRSSIASNPNCPEYLFKKLSKDSNRIVKGDLAQNPNCPPSILRSMLVENDYYVNEKIAGNPNCPTDVLEQLANSGFYDVIKAVYNNPNCNINAKYSCLCKLEKINKDNFTLENVESIPKEYISLFELGVRTNKIENYDKAFYYLFLKITNVNNGKATIELKNDISRRIMEDDFPEEILYYYFLNPSFYGYFTKEAIDKISMIGYKAEHSLVKGVKCKDLYLFNIKKDILRALGHKEKSKDINLVNYIESVGFKEDLHTSYKSDLSIKQNKKSGSKVVLNINSELLSDNINENEVIEFGYYPQDEVSSSDKLMLDTLFKYNLLEVLNAAQNYTFNSMFGDKAYQIYYANNRKFIRYNNTWIEVKPIKWLFDKKNNTLTSLNDLIGGFPKNTERIGQIFYEEVIEPYKILRTLKERKEANEINNIKSEKQVLEQLKEKEKKEKERREKEKEKLNAQRKEIEDLYIEELKLLEDQEKSNKKLIDLGQTIKTSSNEKVSVDYEYLIIQVDDHNEFNSRFIPYFRLIDFSRNLPANMKLSGIDFSETNINIDPQSAYKKDLSNSKFSDRNFTLIELNLEGCNLSGTDLSEVHAENHSNNFEKVVIDDKTKMPKGYKEGKLKIS